MFYLTDTESERLIFKPLSKDYILPWASYLNDPRNTKFYPNIGATPDERAILWINSQLDRYKENTYGMCALHLKTDNTFVGQCGLLKQEVDSLPEVEIGYHLFADHTGKGYATEAAIHLKKYAFRNQLADSIISIITVDNFPSHSVAKRNGMKEDKRTRWKEMDVIIFRTGQNITS